MKKIYGVTHCKECGRRMSTFRGVNGSGMGPICTERVRVFMQKELQAVREELLRQAAAAKQDQLKKDARPYLLPLLPTV